ncbi:MmcQ/YjbR family DNA-binding protein [Parapedobacter deserti]|uniref:MmcQ/YjbR family DNA-binding protein n=1 Tax=Parapedobacter deserti TaxID=1912957 RepID=A0ABV7JPJ8_9SPHI
MHIEQLRDYCLSKPGTTESCPFGPDTLVFKVADKLFLLTGLDSQPLSFSVKCDPAYALELRERHPHTVKGAYHMNKRHWNEVVCNGELTDEMLLHLVDHSYELVVAGLPRKVREQLCK